MLRGLDAFFCQAGFGLQVSQCSLSVSRLALREASAALMMEDTVVDMDCWCSSSKLAKAGMLIWLAEEGESFLLLSFYFVSLVPEAMELFKEILFI